MRQELFNVIKLKKVTLVLVMIICFLFASLRMDYKLSAKASPTTVIVDDNGPADFNNIQKAINNASAGDTIFVRTGTYYENVVINKSIFLIGEDRDLTLVDGSRAGNVISVTTNDAYVENFTVQGSEAMTGSGIFILRSRGSVISNNRIINNSEGISLYNSYSNMIFGNNITANNNDGIFLSSSSNNTFFDNIICSNYYNGIYLDSSSNNTFSRNVISNNGLTGISFYSSGINVIRGNSISANSLYGLALYLFSSSNTIYHNNFNNTIQAWAASTQSWNYNGEGNYWRDYTGRDLNNDGIGDSPYIIVNDNQDKYPLMGTFSDFDVTLERKTYHVTIVSNSTISDFGFQIGTETGNRIIRFKAATGNGKIGFSRVTVPRELMEDPYVVLIDTMKVTPTLLNVSDQAKVHLHFTYSDGNTAINIISSETLHLYSELFTKYLELQGSFQTLNQTYYGLLTNYLKLQTDLFNLSKALNGSSAQYLELQGSFQTLNQTYYGLLTNYSKLLGNYTSLLQNFNAMGTSYQQHLHDNSEQTQNIRSLIYIFAATTAIFIITTLYLSKLQATGMRRRTSGHISSGA